MAFPWKDPRNRITEGVFSMQSCADASVCEEGEDMGTLAFDGPAQFFTKYPVDNIPITVVKLLGLHPAIELLVSPIIRTPTDSFWRDGVVVSDNLARPTSKYALLRADGEIEQKLCAGIATLYANGPKNGSGTGWWVQYDGPWDATVCFSFDHQRIQLRFTPGPLAPAMCLDVLPQA